MLPKSPIVNIFGRSPFKPTQKHMEVVEECAAELVPLVEAFLGGDLKRVEICKERIADLEHQADQVKNEIRTHLPKSLFMPVDRRDLLDLLHAQDSIADTAQDVAEFLTLKDLKVPPSFGELLPAYVDSAVRAARQCGRVIGELDDLLEMGFRGREADRVEEMVATLSAIESENDAQGMELARRLFAEEGLRPADFFILYELIRRIGDVADYAEDVGDRLRLLIAR